MNTLKNLTNSLNEQTIKNYLVQIYSAYSIYLEATRSNTLPDRDFNISKIMISRNSLVVLDFGLENIRRVQNNKTSSELRLAQLLLQIIYKKPVKIIDKTIHFPDATFVPQQIKRILTGLVSETLVWNSIKDLDYLKQEFYQEMVLKSITAPKVFNLDIRYQSPQTKVENSQIKKLEFSYLAYNAKDFQYNLKLDQRKQKPVIESGPIQTGGGASSRLSQKIMSRQQFTRQNNTPKEPRVIKVGDHSYKDHFDRIKKSLSPIRNMNISPNSNGASNGIDLDASYIEQQYIKKKTKETQNILSSTVNQNIWKLSDSKMKQKAFQSPQIVRGHSANTSVNNQQLVSNPTTENNTHRFSFQRNDEESPQVRYSVQRPSRRSSFTAKDKRYSDNEENTRYTQENFHSDKATTTYSQRVGLSLTSHTIEASIQPAKHQNQPELPKINLKQQSFEESPKRAPSVKNNPKQNQSDYKQDIRQIQQKVIREFQETHQLPKSHNTQNTASFQHGELDPQQNVHKLQPQEYYQNKKSSPRLQRQKQTIIDTPPQEQHQKQSYSQHSPPMSNSRVESDGMKKPKIDLNNSSYVENITVGKSHQFEDLSIDDLDDLEVYQRPKSSQSNQLDILKQKSQVQQKVQSQQPSPVLIKKPETQTQMIPLQKPETRPQTQTQLDNIQSSVSSPQHQKQGQSPRQKQYQTQQPQTTQQSQTQQSNNQLQSQHQAQQQLLIKEMPRVTEKTEEDNDDLSRPASSKPHKKKKKKVKKQENQGSQGNTSSFISLYEDQLKKYDIIGKTVAQCIKHFQAQKNFWIIPLFIVFKRMSYFRKSLEMRMLQENIFKLNDEQYLGLLKDERFIKLYEKVKGENQIVFNEMETLLHWSTKQIERLDPNESKKIDKFLNTDIKQNIQDIYFIYLYSQVLKTFRQNTKDNQTEEVIKLEINILCSLILSELPFCEDDILHFDLFNHNENMKQTDIKALQEYRSQKEASVVKLKERLVKKGVNI